jgi:predicted nucleic acid-binding protein
LIVYADSSFVVSLYITDAHSPEARRRVQGAPPLILTPFHRAEWAHALGQNQFRGDLTAADANRLNAQFIADEGAGLFHVTALPDNAFELCADLARSHGSRLAMRPLDSLHVACALELKADRFWTFDDRQAKLAKAQGLKSL